MPQAMDQAQLALALELESRMKTSAQQKLAKDPTGALMRSIRTIRKQGFLAVGTDVEYAGVQDEGATIRPKGQWLAIPKEQPKSLRGKWPRDYARGELYRPGAKGATDRPKVLIHRPTGRMEFVLAKQAVIPATHWFTEVRDSMNEWGRVLLQEELGDHIEGLWR